MEQAGLCTVRDGVSVVHDDIIGAGLGDGVDDFTVSAGGRYYFSEAFAAGIDVSDNDDGTTWGIALRYDFGNRY